LAFFWRLSGTILSAEGRFFVVLPIKGLLEGVSLSESWSFSLSITLSTFFEGRSIFCERGSTVCGAEVDFCEGEFDSPGSIVDVGGLIFDEGGVIFDEGGLIFDEGGLIFDEGGLTFDEGGSGSRKEELTSVTAIVSRLRLLQRRQNRHGARGI
jgi:hypothetical protein